jgi:exopolysaccharide biosynthesis polyprenyl glycosylphosphotransferase
MKNNFTFIYTLVLVVGDFLALLTAFSVAYVLRVKLDTRPLITAIPARTYLLAFVAILPLWILVLGSIGLYRKSVYENRFSELGRLLVGSFLGILVVIGYDFVTQAKIFPARLVPVYALVIGFVFLVIFRNLARLSRSMLFSYGIGITNILIIGDGQVANELIKSLADSRISGYQIVGVVGEIDKLESPGGLSVFRTFELACAGVGADSIHSIVQTELYSSVARNAEILDYAQTSHIAYRFIPGNSALFVGNIDVELFRSVPVVAVHQTALIGWGRVTKRLFDLFAASLLLVVASPFMIIVAVLEVIIGGGLPVFFRQTRLTRFNQEFRVYKFRSHRNGLSGLSDQEAFTKLGHPELYEQYCNNGNLLKSDPRLTKLGRFLRKTSLDELPQLFNVIKGDVSLVGPRALIPEELNSYTKKHTILSVKSGLTGLAQVSGRRGISFEERRKLDMYYVRNWTFWTDIVILLKTVRVILTGEGAQ